MKYLLNLIKRYQRKRKLQRLYDLVSTDALLIRNNSHPQWIQDPSKIVCYCSPEAWDLARELNVVSVHGVRLVPTLAVSIMV